MAVRTIKALLEIDLDTAKDVEVRNAVEGLQNSVEGVAEATVALNEVVETTSESLVEMDKAGMNLGTRLSTYLDKLTKFGSNLDTLAYALGRLEQQIVRPMNQLVTEFIRVAPAFDTAKQGWMDATNEIERSIKMSLNRTSSP